jgi:hypothetical protein
VPFWKKSVITDLAVGADELRRHRYGVIEIAEGKLCRITFRRWPKFISLPEIRLFGRWKHESCDGDFFRIYYNQPLRCSNYLILKYAESSRQTGMASIVRGLAVLDEIARLKQSDALLCDASNERISTRSMHRFGWEPHCPSRFHRHFIKRFYGKYASMDAA